MSYLFTRANSDRITTTGVLPTPGGNWTLACWIKPTSPANTTDILTALSCGIAANNAGQRIRANSPTTVGIVGIHEQNESTLSSASASAQLYDATGRWSFAAVRWSSTTAPLRRAVLHAGSTPATNSRWATTTAELVSVGSTYKTAAHSDHFDGYIAEAAIWSSALSQDDLLSLAAGAYPSGIAAASLVAYVPLLADAADTKGNTWTVTGAVVDADHPTMGSGGSSTVIMLEGD